MLLLPWCLLILEISLQEIFSKLQLRKAGSVLNLLTLGEATQLFKPVNIRFYWLE
jgi:hypothetical protein